MKTIRMLAFFSSVCMASMLSAVELVSPGAGETVCLLNGGNKAFLSMDAAARRAIFKDMTLSRRSFLFSAGAAGFSFVSGAVPTAGKILLRFGALSDSHVTVDPATKEPLRRILRGLPARTSMPSAMPATFAKAETLPSFNLWPTSRRFLESVPLSV